MDYTVIKIAGELILEVRAKMDRFKADLKGAMSDIKDVQIGSKFEGLIKEMSSDFGGFVSSLRNVIKEGTGALTGGVSGTKGAILIAGVALTALTATAAMVGKINDNIKQMVRQLADSSMALKGLQSIQDRTLSLVLKPMGDMMSTLMRPYLMLQMNILRKGMKDITPLMREFQKAETFEEKEAIGKEISERVRGMLTGIFEISQEINMLTKPIAAELGGFIKGLELVFNTWISGVDASFKGFKDALGATFAPLSNTLAESIIEGFKTGKQSFMDLSPRMRTKLLSWLSKNGWEDLPKSASKDILTWLKKDGWEDLPASTAGELLKPNVMSMNGWDTMPYDVGDILRGELESKANLVKIVDPVTGAFTTIAEKILNWDLPKKDEKSLLEKLGGLGLKIRERFGFQTGTDYVSKEGMYYLHRGEQVVGATQGNKKGITVNNTFDFSGSSFNSEIDVESTIQRAARDIELSLRSSGL